MQVKRIALIEEQLAPLPSFSVLDKYKDPRYGTYGHDRCWEIDALDPNELRDCVEASIYTCILDRDAWERCERVCNAERDSLRHVLTKWGDSGGTYD